ncbi:MAG TPA: lipase family protein [Candidatus Ozemobacteraceae bacterium]|nr:lipase family protein [Candidatus Ozemobacteraceae bacterium]
MPHNDAHRTLFRYFAILCCLLAVSVPGIGAAGSPCFQTVFNTQTDGHDPVNAYLLMLACTYSYPNRINTATFEEFTAKYKARFSEWGMNTFDFIDVRQKTADTQVMIMSNERLVIVVFRGSESSSGGSFSPVKAIYDWILTDLNFFPKPVEYWGRKVRVHRGFWNALDVVYPRLKTMVNDHLAGSDKRLWITGHSLGAGIVPLAAYRLAFDGVPVYGVFSFAGPRVGNEEFTDLCRDRFPQFQRWVNDHDLVTMLPFPWLGFKHVSKPNNLYNDGRAVIGDRAFNGLGKVASHPPGPYLQKLYALLPPALRLQVPAPSSLEVTDSASDPGLEKEFRIRRWAHAFFNPPEEED